VKLTEKQKRFIDYYIETGNATEAARKAGYKGKNLDVIGSQNLVKLRKFIDEKLKQKESERIASQDEVLEFLTRVMRGQEIEEVVGFTENGPVKEKKAPSTRDRIKAAELLGKRYALFTDKLNVDATVGVQIIDDIEDEDVEDDTVV